MLRQLGRRPHRVQRPPVPQRPQLDGWYRVRYGSGSARV